VDKSNSFDTDYTDLTEHTDLGRRALLSSTYVTVSLFLLRAFGLARGALSGEEQNALNKKKRNHMYDDPSLVLRIQSQ
jgi:hypothetical protein